MSYELCALPSDVPGYYGDEPEVDSYDDGDCPECETTEQDEPGDSHYEPSYTPEPNYGGRGW